jgi:hypothetical protein
MTEDRMPKREPRWVKVFLRELERTGNVQLAAERVGVDHTTAYQRRKRHGPKGARLGAGIILPVRSLNFINFVKPADTVRRRPAQAISLWQ